MWGLEQRNKFSNIFLHYFIMNFHWFSWLYDLWPVVFPLLPSLSLLSFTYPFSHLSEWCHLGGNFKIVSWVRLQQGEEKYPLFSPVESLVKCSEVMVVSVKYRVVDWVVINLMFVVTRDAAFNHSHQHMEAEFNSINGPWYGLSIWFLLWCEFLIRISYYLVTKLKSKL